MWRLPTLTRRRRCMVTASAWIPSTFSRSRWSSPSNMASSSVPTAMRTSRSSALSPTSPTTSRPTGQSSVLATFPLISHGSPDAVVAYRAGVPLTARTFLSDVRQVAAALPARRHVLNACTDRYRFTVAFAASLVANKVSLLPSTHTPEVIRQLTQFAPDVFCLTDDARCQIDLPRVRFPELVHDEDASWEPLEIEADRLAAYVFTSGSTGTPLPYRKTWGRLVNCVRYEAERLGLLGDSAVGAAGARSRLGTPSHTIVGTVPPQHMYGFESTVLLALQSGNAFSAGKPFFPADVCAELD